MSEEHGRLAFFLFGVAVDGLDLIGYVNRSSWVSRNGTASKISCSGAVVLDEFLLCRACCRSDKIASM
jgi:hypothetical protein